MDIIKNNPYFDPNTKFVLSLDNSNLEYFINYLEYYSFINNIKYKNL